MNIKKDATIEFKKNGEWYRANVTDIDGENVVLHIFATQPVNAWRYFTRYEEKVVCINEIEELIEIEKEVV